jgi:polysaccharide pyruvyl transferase WcaK-like protein
MKKILVYGWYNHLNIGDELFVSAFRKLFPDFQFTFRDNITLSSLEDVDAVFFGGGSFLLDRPNITADAFEKLKTKKIFYLGVGVEANIHPTHIELITIAKLVATRSQDQLDRLQFLNPNSIWIPDLVYACQSDVENSPKISRSVLVMPNISVVPHSANPYWAHASWAHFKSEFSQFLDHLVEEGYHIDFLSMCRGPTTNDDWAASELIAHMVKRGKYLLKEQPVGIERVTRLISKYNIVITQRFHGIVLSEMTRTPYIAIHHHDKLKYCQPVEGTILPYYNSSKHSFIEAFNSTMKMNFSKPLPIESNIFENLIQEVISLV